MLTKDTIGHNGEKPMKDLKDNSRSLCISVKRRKSKRFRWLSSCDNVSRKCKELFKTF